MMSGTVVANAKGEHFQTEKLYHSIAATAAWTSRV